MRSCKSTTHISKRINRAYRSDRFTAANAQRTDLSSAARRARRSRLRPRQGLSRSVLSKVAARKSQARRPCSSSSCYRRWAYEHPRFTNPFTEGLSESPTFLLTTLLRLIYTTCFLGFVSFCIAWCLFQLISGLTWSSQHQTGVYGSPSCLSGNMGQARRRRTR